MEPPELTRKMKRDLKLIELYKEHECLWNQCSKNFFNFALREQIWEDIAKQLYPAISPQKSKRRIYIMRYNAEMEHLHQQEANFYKLNDDELPPKLHYADKFQFLNHMFDSKICKHAEVVEATAAAAAPAQEKLETMPAPTPSLAVMCMRLGRQTNPLRYTKKQRAFERLRKSGFSAFSLSLEAIRKLELVTGGSKKSPGK